MNDRRQEMWDCLTPSIRSSITQALHGIEGIPFEMLRWGLVFDYFGRVHDIPLCEGQRYRWPNNTIVPIPNGLVELPRVRETILRHLNAGFFNTVAEAVAALDRAPDIEARRYILGAWAGNNRRIIASTIASGISIALLSPQDDPNNIYVLRNQAPRAGVLRILPDSVARITEVALGSGGSSLVQASATTTDQNAELPPHFCLRCNRSVIGAESIDRGERKVRCLTCRSEVIQNNREELCAALTRANGLLDEAAERVRNHETVTLDLQTERENNRSLRNELSSLQRRIRENDVNGATQAARRSAILYFCFSCIRPISLHPSFNADQDAAPKCSICGKDSCDTSDVNAVTNAVQALIRAQPYGWHSSESQEIVVDLRRLKDVVDNPFMPIVDEMIRKILRAEESVRQQQGGRIDRGLSL